MSHPGGSKRLLFLGAGVFQLVGIRAALALGHHVITLDNRPESPGHRISHQFADCSTVDVAEVVRIAERERIDAVFSMASDIAVPTQARVAQHLSLPGPSPEIADTFCAKDRLRRFQRDHGLPHPSFTEGSDLAHTLKQLPAGIDSLIVKPSDTSGSRGVARVAADDRVDLERAFESARAFGRSGVVCVEEYVEGEDVSVDGLVSDGRIVIAHFTRKFRMEFVPTGHMLPGPLDPDSEARAREAVETHVRAAGYTDGPFDADLRVSDQRCVLLEMSPRLGGNGVPMVVSRHTGVDLVEWAVRGCLGERITPPAARDPLRGCASMLLTSPRDGRIESVASAQSVRNAVPAVTGFDLAVGPGDPVNAFRHGGDVLGYALFDCDSTRDYEITSAAIRRALDLRLIDRPENEDSDRNPKPAPHAG